MDRKRVNWPGEFVGKHGIHHPMAFDPAFAGECGRHDMHPEVAFTAWTVAGVTGMKMRLVDHREALRLQCRFQFPLYLQFDRHDAPILIREPAAP